MATKKKATKKKVAKKKSKKKSIPTTKGKTLRKDSESPFRQGRPTKFTEQAADLITFYAADGLTDKEIAQKMNIDQATLYNWYEKHTSFFQSVMAGKGKADEVIEGALYKKAHGYSREYWETEIDSEGKEKKVKKVKHFEPDSRAQQFWLKNRKKATWKDKQEIEHTTEKDLNIKLNYNVNPKGENNGEK
jgi:hypothetical protein